MAITYLFLEVPHSFLGQAHYPLLVLLLLLDQQLQGIHIREDNFSVLYCPFMNS